MDAAIPAMLERGSQFFADIELHQVDKDGLALLRHLAKVGENQTMDQAAFGYCLSDPEIVQATLALLARRELLSETNGHYHFQVEAIRRLFAR